MIDPLRPLAKDAGTQLDEMRLWSMADDKTYDGPSLVKAEDGDVVLDGPDGVDVKMTPDAAVQTSDRMFQGSVRAQGQRVRKLKSG
jgi:hypothetical protein